jgi:D-aminoacyl-tRNA deacylase
MNIRRNLLNPKIGSFKETKFTWHQNPVFELKKEGLTSNLSEIFKDAQVYIGLTKDPLIFLNDLKLEESQIKPEFLIFASRHTSKTAQPAFLVHTTGNWSNNADFGGDSRDLSFTSALLHKAGFLSFIEGDYSPTLSNFSYDIEVTHHGPTRLEVPLIFMELGSSNTEWEIEKAGESIASVILNTIFKFLQLKHKNDQIVGLGFGGTHYAPNFSRLIKTKNIAMSFICPKYYIQELDSEIIGKMIYNTTEKVDHFIIDWKGTNSEDKKHLIPLLEDFDISIKKTKDF